MRKLVAPQSVHVAVLDDNTLIVFAGRRNASHAGGAIPAGEVGTAHLDGAGQAVCKPHKADLGTLVVMEDSLHPGLQLISDEPTKETFDQFEHVRFHVRPGKSIEVETVVQGKSTELGPTLEKKARRVLEVVREELPNVMRDETRRAASTNWSSRSASSERTADHRQGAMTEAAGKKFFEGDKKDR